MCLILVRDANVELPYDQVCTAVRNNPDGWGYVIPDRGDMEIRRFYNGENTDPDDVARFLDDNINQKIYLHLRYATAGAKSKANVHPFPVLTKRKHGTQVMAMHNGTYSDYRPNKGSQKSDTAIFVEEVLTPILARFAKNNSKKSLLLDPVVETVIDKFNEGWSRLVLVDGYGNDIKLGDGKYNEEGYWVSNDYSFRPDHRTPATTRSNSTYSGTTVSGQAPGTKPGLWIPSPNTDGTYTYKKYDKNSNTTCYRYGKASEAPDGTVWPVQQDDTDANKVANEYKKRQQEQVEEARASGTTPFRNDSGSSSKHGTSGTSATSPVRTPIINTLINTKLADSFLDQYGLDSWDEMFALDIDDIESLVLEYPELMARGFMDLLFIVYQGETVAERIVDVEYEELDKEEAA